MLILDLSKFGVKRLRVFNVTYSCVHFTASWVTSQASKCATHSALIFISVVKPQINLRLRRRPLNVLWMKLLDSWLGPLCLKCAVFGWGRRCKAHSKRLNSDSASVGEPCPSRQKKKHSPQGSDRRTEAEGFKERFKAFVSSCSCLCVSILNL